jgi:4-hydroxybenzoate polyprenyltransferase
VSAARDWAELLRLPALFTVPGDALAGAAAGGGRPGARTLGAVAASLCLYSAGMVLNDWADREEDARERPGRPLPSGRVRPGAALAAAGGLTAAGIGCAALAGRRAVVVAGPLAATVWAYDLYLKHTPLGPVAMGAARGLDLLMGAASTGPLRGALPSALAVGAHTCAVTVVSRHETRGGAVLPAVSALAVTAAVTAALARGPVARDDADSAARPGPASTPDARPGLRGRSAPLAAAASRGAMPSARAARSEHVTAAVGVTPPVGAARPGRAEGPGGGRPFARVAGPERMAGSGSATPPAGTARSGRAGGRGGGLVPLAAAAFAVTAARPLVHAALNPSPQLTQRAVGGGIRALIPLQAALAARAGAPVTALLTAALAPVARRLGRKVSLT